MQRLFFHNPHDKESINMLNQLPPDVRVFNVFGSSNVQKDELPPIFIVSQLPYLIDKQIILLSSPPYLVGTVTLNFECRDYEDNILLEESNDFTITINNNNYHDIPENGIITIELECLIPTNISIRIDGNGYYPFEGTIEVIDSA
jgi:hypothetical protein